MEEVDIYSQKRVFIDYLKITCINSPKEVFVYLFFIDSQERVSIVSQKGVSIVILKFVFNEFPVEFSQSSESRPTPSRES